jgi:hypothetical protein
MSRADANQLAFALVRDILEAARPLTLQIGGTTVNVTVSRDAPAPWPERALAGVTPVQTLPPSVRADCTWPGGKVTLTADLSWETIPKYADNVCLAIYAGGRCLLWCNVRAAIDRAGDAPRATIHAWAAVIKRGAAAAEQPEINQALRKLVASAGLPLAPKSESKIVLADVDLARAQVVDGAAAAFERAMLLALLKLDFVARRGLAKRGAPIVDFARLELSDAAIAILTRAHTDGDAGNTDEDDADDTGAATDGDSEPDRLRRRFQRAAPDPADRQAALELLAYAIENAHDERPSGWYLYDRSSGLALFTGRLLALGISRGTIGLSVMGPISDETRAALSAEEGENEAWKAIPGGLYLKFPVAKARAALDLLRGPFDRFVDEAMARMRRRIDPAGHKPEVVDFVAQEVGRALPQPSLDAAEPVVDESDDEEGDAPEAAAAREPALRGRPPIFDKGHRSIVSLLADVERGAIALPDLQRPFVWPDTKVRDLLDSLFVGFPTGSVVLWHTDGPTDAHVLGGTARAPRAASLVIDGQQRLTSLYAVMKGVAVVDKDGEQRTIRIAFRPRDGRFDVADAAVRQDPEYLADVSELWRGPRGTYDLRHDLFAGLTARGRTLDDAYKRAVEHNLERAKAIAEFEFPVVEIRKSAGDEDVAEIFVRINNQGTRLGQADFVLTLLSVFHGSLRDRIQARADTIAKESTVGVDAQQLLRAACAVAFERASMAAIYKFLRGVDPTTGEADGDKRKQRLAALDEAAAECIDPTTWRDYLVRVSHAGFVNQSLIASQNAIVNAFALYVKGQRTGLDHHRLDRLISRWLFATLLTRRYSGSSESQFEADLSRTRGLGPGDGDAFAKVLEDFLAESITGDFWTRTLVGELRTQKARAASPLGFRAAQIILNARALFSDTPLWNVLSPGAGANRAATEQHHLFPRAWLMNKGVTDRREINQVANLADIGWNDNLDIGASPPSSYVPRLRDRLRLDDGAWARMCAEHALPPGWELLPYATFLEQRRERMADLIRVAFGKLAGADDLAPVTPPWFLPGAQDVWRRIVDTERGLRGVVREVYSKRYGANAPSKIEAALPEAARETLSRALRARPAGADPLSVVDYLYLAQLPPLLFSNDVWGDARARLGGSGEAKERLSTAIGTITKVRNEIAHVREVSQDNLQRAHVACGDVLSMLAKAAT